MEEHEYSLLEHALPLIIHDCEKEPEWNEVEADTLRELFEAWEDEHSTTGDRKTGSPVYDELLGWNLVAWKVWYMPGINELQVELDYGKGSVCHIFYAEREDIKRENGFIFKSVSLKNYTFDTRATGMTCFSSVKIDENVR